MSERKLWAWTLILGLATFGWSYGFGYFEGLKACATPPGWGAILALEYARDAGQAAAILANDACIAGQRGALWWDTIGFIPLYTAFLILAALAAGGPLRMAAIAAALLGALGDWVESWQLFRILADTATGDYATLIFAVRAKFMLLAVATIVIGGRLLQRRSWLILPGAIIIAGGAFGAVSVMPDERAPMIMLAMTVAWVPLLLTAAVLAFRPIPR